MIEGSKIVLGVNTGLVDMHKNMIALGATMPRIATKTQVLAKVFGPLAGLYVDAKMAIDSVGKTLGGNTKTMETAAKATSALAVPVGAVAVGFSGIVTALLPFVGIALGVVAAMVLLTAAFDQGGGALRQWLEDMPILSDLLAGTEQVIAFITEGFAGFGTEGGNALSKIMDFYADFYGSVVVGLMDTFTMLEESGALGDLADMAVDSFGIITAVVTTFVDFLLGAGIIDFMKEVYLVMFELVATTIIVATAIIKAVVGIVNFLRPVLEPYSKFLLNYWGIVADVFMGMIRTIIAGLRIWLAVLRGDFGKAKELLSGIKDMWAKTFDSMKEKAMNIVGIIMDFIQPLVDALGTITEGVGNVVGGVGNRLGFAKGGVVSGPSSGYPVTLHGTEAVVPLPDGRTIPVTIEGMGGTGGPANITINVSGANGDPKRIARAVSDEVAKQFRNRSRGSGFSRGV